MVKDEGIKARLVQRLPEHKDEREEMKFGAISK